MSQKGLNSYELPGRQQIQQGTRNVYELLTARSAANPGETALQKRERLAQADSLLIGAAADLSRMVLERQPENWGTKGCSSSPTMHYNTCRFPFYRRRAERIRMLSAKTAHWCSTTR